MSGETSPVPASPSVLQSVLAPASPEAAHAAQVSWVLIVGAGVVFVIVMAALAWALLRRRRDTPASHAGRWLVGAGVVFPTVVLSAFSVWLYTVGPAALAAHDAQAVVVRVTAHGWWWDVRYRDPATGAEVRTANEIHLPAGRPITLALTSADVIHSFWVPALGGKVDMLPGRWLHLRLQSAEVGTYRGQCAEFCGEQHARMALQVVVRDAASFERWLADQARPAAPPAQARAARGLQVYNDRRCSACHAIRGLTPDAALGPDLTHVGSRSMLGAGTLPNDEANLRSWIAEVQQHKRGARMPSSAMDDAALADLAHFLAGLR